AKDLAVRKPSLGTRTHHGNSGGDVDRPRRRRMFPSLAPWDASTLVVSDASAVPSIFYSSSAAGTALRALDVLYMSTGPPGRPRQYPHVEILSPDFFLGRRFWDRNKVRELPTSKLAWPADHLVGKQVYEVVTGREFSDVWNTKRLSDFLPPQGRHGLKHFI